MSVPVTKCCGSPPVVLVAALVVASGACVKPLMFGAGGGLKSGPTAQPARTSKGIMRIRNPKSEIPNPQDGVRGSFRFRARAFNRILIAESLSLGALWMVVCRFMITPPIDRLVARRLRKARALEIR